MPINSGPDYNQAALSKYQASTAGRFKQDKRQEREDIAGRGLGTSGARYSSEIGLQQGRANELSGVSRDLGLRSSDIQEAERVRNLMRGYDVQDTGMARDFNAEMVQKNKDQQQAAAQAAQWGSIMKAAGQVGGSALAKYQGNQNQVVGLPPVDLWYPQEELPPTYYGPAF